MARRSGHADLTASNWSTPQGVTVTGVDDAPCDGNVAYAILTAAARSADLGYNNLDPDNVAVTNTDNDCARATTGTTTPPPPLTHGGIRISIKNDYNVALNFGPLGHGTRKAPTRPTACSNARPGSTRDRYAKVYSTQTLAGMGGSEAAARPPTGTHRKLKVTGHPVDGFNTMCRASRS